MSDKKELHKIIKNFKQRIEEVEKLLEIDDLILSLAIEELEDRQESLNKCGIDNASMIGENSLKNLRNIRTNQSLKPSYVLLLNQSVVLMVSYFASSMHDFFKTAYPLRLSCEMSKKARSKELKFSLQELQDYNFDLTDSIGEIIFKKFNINFQDMATISGSLRDYLGIDMEWDKRVNNIVAMQACRNSIAHSGEIVDEKLVNQLRRSQDRDIQKDLKIGNKISFTVKEVKLGANEMLSYLENAVNIV